MSLDTSDISDKSILPWTARALSSLFWIHFGARVYIVFCLCCDVIRRCGPYDSPNKVMPFVWKIHISKTISGPEEALKNSNVLFWSSINFTKTVRQKRKFQISRVVKSKWPGNKSKLASIIYFVYTYLFNNLPFTTKLTPYEICNWKSAVK